MKTTDICRQQGISETTFYNWKAKDGGMESADINRLRELEAENQRLKRMYAELSLDHQILKAIVEKSSDGRATTRAGDGHPVRAARERTTCLPDCRHQRSVQRYQSRLRDDQALVAALQQLSEA